MTSLWKKVSKIIFIYIVLCAVTVKGLKKQSFTYDFGKEQICDTDSSMLVSPGQVYGCCENTILSKLQDKSSANCTFIMETTKSINSSDHLRICHFTIPNDFTKYNPNFRINSESGKNGVSKITAIDKDKAFLKLYGKIANLNSAQYLLFILHFNDCRAIGVNWQLKEPLAMSPYDDKFDLIFENDSSKMFYKAVVDTQGNIITNAQPWLPSLNKDIYESIYSTVKSRLVVMNHYIRAEKNVARIMMVKDNGSFEILKEMPMDDYKYAHVNYPLERMITSSTYNLISVCTKLNMILRCSQFDNNGNQQFQTTFPLYNFPFMMLLSLHNLPNGGFLFVTGECDKVINMTPHISPTLVCDNSSYFVVKKVDATGRFLGSAKIDNTPRIIKYEKVHAYENEEKELCLSYIDRDEETGEYDYSTLYVSCLHDDDFSMIIKQ